MRYGWHLLVHRRRLAEEAISQTFGRAIHKALETRYNLAGSAPADQVVQQAQESIIKDAFKALALPEEEWRNEGRAQELISAYNAEYGQEPYECVSSEESLEREIGVIDTPMGLVRVVWQGRLDSIIRYDGRLRVRDFKTTGYSGTSSEATHNKYKVSGQLLGYCFLASEKYGPVMESQIDVLIYRPPLKKVGANSLPRNEFQRHEFRHTEAQLDAWKADVLTDARIFLAAALSAQEPPPKRRTSCAWPSKCPFYGVCEIDSLEGQMDWLYGSQYVDNEWNPMTGTDGSE
jgi:hypothetical protein